MVAPVMFSAVKTFACLPLDADALICSNVKAITGPVPFAK